MESGGWWDDAESFSTHCFLPPIPFFLPMIFHIDFRAPSPLTFEVVKITKEARCRLERENASKSC
jgi:hypothetical protein